MLGDKNKKIYEAYERSILGLRQIQSTYGPMEYAEKAGLVDRKKKKKKDKKLDEKWAKKVVIQKTGEYAGKSVKELKTMLAALEGKKPFDREKHSEVMFAIRSKGGWVKGKGAVKKSKEKPKKKK